MLLYQVIILFLFPQLPIIMVVAFSMCIICLLMAGKSILSLISQNDLAWVWTFGIWLPETIQYKIASQSY